MLAAVAFLALRICWPYIYGQLHPSGTGGETARIGAENVYYRNCAAARADGAAPIYVGQPGYRPELDGDRDGIACEPYPR
jgi:hypothetical protein